MRVQLDRSWYYGTMTLETRHVNLRLSGEIHHDLTFISQVTGISLNATITEALQNYIAFKYSQDEFHKAIDLWVFKRDETIAKAKP